ncbi:hypothetical protein T484DRAFT_1802598 [Baffinella frigidus]|nr:hypothetical protein T484DRAFT_1802598 [Cryptophyta sp. CCMP2293]
MSYRRVLRNEACAELLASFAHTLLDTDPKSSRALAAGVCGAAGFAHTLLDTDPKSSRALAAGGEAALQDVVTCLRYVWSKDVFQHNYARLLAK